MWEQFLCFDHVFIHIFVEGCQRAFYKCHSRALNQRPHLLLVLCQPGTFGSNNKIKGGKKNIYWWRRFYLICFMRSTQRNIWQFDGIWRAARHCRKNTHVETPCRKKQVLRNKDTSNVLSGLICLLWVAMFGVSLHSTSVACGVLQLFGFN